MEAVGSSETFLLVYQAAILYIPEVHSANLHYFKDRNNFLYRVFHNVLRDYKNLL